MISAKSFLLLTREATVLLYEVERRRAYCCDCMEMISSTLNTCLSLKLFVLFGCVRRRSESAT